MKIDIHITDATPEETRAMFAVLPVAMFVHRPPVPDPEPADVVADSSSVPDPVPGHTGCEGCDHDLRDVAECERCSPPPTPEPKMGKRGPQKANKYGIPPELMHTDKKKYQRLWWRCKNKGITYEEALKQDREPKPRDAPAKKMGRQPLATTPAKVVEKSSEPLFDEVIQKTANPPHEPIVRGCEPARCKDGSLPASAAHGKIRELVAVKNGELRAGQRIKHNGPKASPFFGKEGKIVKVSPNSGEVFVDFGASSTWLAPHIVMVVPEVPA